MSKRNELYDKLVKQGFSVTTRDSGKFKVSCDQCQAVCINGVACHEIGCPIERKNRPRACDTCGYDYFPVDGECCREEETLCD